MIDPARVTPNEIKSMFLKIDRESRFRIALKCLNEAQPGRTIALPQESGRTSDVWFKWAVAGDDPEVLSHTDGGKRTFEDNLLASNVCWVMGALSDESSSLSATRVMVRVKTGYNLTLPDEFDSQVDMSDFAPFVELVSLVAKQEDGIAT